MHVNYVLAVVLEHGPGALDEPRLRVALDGAAGRHPAFHTFPGTAPAMDPETVAPFALRVAVRTDAAQWLREAEAELGTPFPPDEGARARFVLLPGSATSELLLVADHFTTEGLSGTVLLREMLTLLRDPAAVLPGVPAAPTPAELLPPELREGILPAPADRPRRRPSPPGVPGPDPVRIRTHELSHAGTRGLAQACHRESTHVHAALCAAWLRALAGTTPSTAREDTTGTVGLPAAPHPAAPTTGKAPDSEHTRRSVSSPVSVRGFLPPGGREVAGMYLTTLRTEVDVHPDRTLWQVARDVQQDLDLHTAAPQLPELFAAGLARFASGHPPTADYDLSLTNLGVQEFGGPIRPADDSTAPEDDPAASGEGVAVRACYPLVNALPAERTVGVCTTGGRLHLAFTTFATDLDDRWAAAVLSAAVENLRLMVERSGPGSAAGAAGQRPRNFSNPGGRVRFAGPAS